MWIELILKLVFVLVIATILALIVKKLISKKPENETKDVQPSPKGNGGENFLHKEKPIQWEKITSAIIFLLKNFWKRIDSIATLFIGLATLYVVINQFKVSTQLQRVQNQMYETEISIVEGELVSNLLSSLIQGSESEREMALWILQSKAPNIAKQILPIISQKDPSPKIRKNAERQLGYIKFTNHLKNANIYLELGRYSSAAEYFYKATAFVDSSMVDIKLLNVAISRYKAGSDSLAVTLFEKAFLNY